MTSASLFILTVVCFQTCMVVGFAVPEVEYDVKNSQSFYEGEGLKVSHFESSQSHQVKVATSEKREEAESVSKQEVNKNGGDKEGRQPQTNATHHWKQIFLGLSIMLAIFMTFRFLTRLLPYICGSGHPAATHRRHRSNLPIYCMARGTAAANLPRTRGTVFTIRSGTGSTVIPIHGAVALNLQKTPSSSFQNEVSEQLTSSQKEERPMCETPPPPYSPAMLPINQEGIN